MTTEAKIGIGIVHCQSTPSSPNIGFTIIYKSDEGKWSSIIDDTGDVFSHVKIDYETILRMIHFSKDGEGWYMCSMKPIPGRDEEYRASWVYFPSSLDLSQKDIKTVIDVAESQIRQKEFDRKKLQEVIQSYTLCKEFSPRYNVPSVQHGFAFRDISGDYNLFDLYGCMYQKDFTQYEWVILMKKSSLTFKGDGIEDISNRKILESHVIKPTSNEFGFIPYYNGAEFKTPVRIIDGESLIINFKRQGYKDINKSVRTQEDFSIYLNECLKYFKKSQFVAIDSKTNNQIPYANIKPLEAIGDDKQQLWYFPESKLEIAKFRISAEGYVDDTFERDLREVSLNEDISFSLEPNIHIYVFEVPLDDSVVRDHHFETIKIESQNEIKKSPLIGYGCKGKIREGQKNPNRLYYAGQGKVEKDNSKELVTKKTSDGRKKPVDVKSVLIVLAAFVVGFLLKSLLDKDNVDEKPKKEKVQNLPSDTTTTTHESIAIGYLRKHTNQISKNEMEAFEELKGLYDMIDGYRFKDLVDFIDKHKSKSEILGINEWNRLYNKAKEIGSNKNGQYNQNEAGQSITFEEYLNNLEKKKDIGANQESEIVNFPNNQNKNQKDGNSNGQKKHQNDGGSGGKIDVTNDDKSKKQSAPQK